MVSELFRVLASGNSHLNHDTPPLTARVVFSKHALESQYSAQGIIQCFLGDCGQCALQHFETDGSSRFGNG